MSNTEESPENSTAIYELPFCLNIISGSLKVDDPPTPVRIGQLSTFFERMNPSTGTKYWVGVAWAEVFYPVSGEKPSSVLGSKVYEVVLKRPIQNGGQIIRENVRTTGRVMGKVIGNLPYESVAVKVEDWFVESDMFKAGHWEQLGMALPIVSAEDGVHTE